MTGIPRTFSESWYRVAGQKICLRPAVRVRRQNFRGERWIILENPFSNQYFRLRPAAYEFVARLRADGTVEQAWQECLDRFPDAAPSQEDAIQLLAQLYFANLLQYDLAADSAQLFERYKSRRQRELGFSFLNIMFMRFPLLDPDRFLVRTLRALRWLISPWGAALWLLVVGFGLQCALSNAGALRAQGEGILNPGNLALLYLGVILVKTLHEFGHAYFCRRFGGEVHIMGVMLMIFTPMPYVDATSSWSFRERWKRALVGMAGMITEIFFAAIAAVVWSRTGPGAVHSLAYNIMFVASVSTLLFNINPLMRFDGYYILSDLLEIPNLNQRSQLQLQAWCERFLFGIKNPSAPAGSRREAAWLGVFGVASGIYRVVVFTGILLVVADRFLIVGLVMAAFCLVSWTFMPLFKLTRYLAFSPRLERVRARAIGVSLGLFAFLLVLLAVVPFPHSLRAPGIVKATQRTDTVNEAPGRVVLLCAEPGAWVLQGQPLLVLTNPELTLAISNTRAHLDEINARLRLAQDEDPADIQPLSQLHDSVSFQIQKLLHDQEHLMVKARHDGFWIAPSLSDFSGRWLPQGTELGLLVNPAHFEFHAIVAEDDAKALFGAPLHRASVRLAGQADQKLAVGSWKVIPGGQNILPSPALGWAGGGDVPVSTQENPQGDKSAEPFFEVIAGLNPGGSRQVMDGRSGKISFQLAPEPLLPRWTRSLWQLLQKRYEL